MTGRVERRQGRYYKVRFQDGSTYTVHTYERLLVGEFLQFRYQGSLQAMMNMRITRSDFSNETVEEID